MPTAVSAIQFFPRPSAQSAAESEIETVERAKHDPAAFGVLYDRNVERIYRFVYSRVRDRCLAEDITEEVFMSALKNIAKYRFTGACFSSWLYKIACNAIVSHYRRAKSEVPLESASHIADRTDGVLEEVVRRDRSRRIWEAIGRLPAKQREAMTLRFSADLPHYDVARMMGRSPAAVKLLIYRAVQRLRCELVTLED
jgi:RNA polymerase sigma-70 factor (ECF subfamily)